MAICALESRGIKRSEWTHKGVHSDFVFNFVRGRKIVPATFASALPTAMEIRHIADYRQSGASQRQAERVVRLASEFSERLSKEMFNASNPPKTPSRQDLLETKISELTALIKELSPQARVEISFERNEDEDAHIHVYPSSAIDPEEIAQIERTMGERCNDILLETGLFLTGAVCDT